mgnify:CR=1 FL=1
MERLALLKGHLSQNETGAKQFIEQVPYSSHPPPSYHIISAQSIDMTGSESMVGASRILNSFLTKMVKLNLPVAAIFSLVNNSPSSENGLKRKSALI